MAFTTKRARCSAPGSRAAPGSRWTTPGRATRTFTAENRAAQATVRAAIWQLYRDIKAYRGAPSQERKIALAAEFDRIFTGTTGFVTLDRLLARLHANKAELLVVLGAAGDPAAHQRLGERHPLPEPAPAKAGVTRRRISAGTRSDAGRDARDTFLALAKTCAKLGIRFWDYLGARLAVPGAAIIPPLPELILVRARPPQPPRLLPCYGESRQLSDSQSGSRATS